ncbi:MAG: exodeoxyribonuclease III [Deltaproteobacteria bacterium]|nr:exodeoxyribonuclease III [Deltaproteobacteria bacterium]
MRIVTWNVNSIRAREERLAAFLKTHAPDVLCLQELKCQEHEFPQMLVQSCGYRAVLWGQKTYNGVAILAKEDPQDVTRGFNDGGDPEGEQARFIVAKVRGVRVASAYFVNGGALGSDKWDYKLKWMRRLRAWLDANVRRDEPFALCGDFNVAPEARDVHAPEKWESSVLYHPDVRKALLHVQDFGLVDTFRKHVEGNVYSWWDYRAGAFNKDQGLRIDHVYATPVLAERSLKAEVIRDERKGQGASDHAPVVVEFSD